MKTLLNALATALAFVLGTHGHALAKLGRNCSGGSSVFRFNEDGTKTEYVLDKDLTVIEAWYYDEDGDLLGGKIYGNPSPDGQPGGVASTPEATDAQLAKQNNAIRGLVGGLEERDARTFWNSELDRELRA